MILKYFKSFLLILLLLFAVDSYCIENREEKGIELTVRMIGDKLLFRTGDSTSRVLPVQRNENTYILRFEKDFALVPDDLIQLSHKYIETLGWKDGVIIEVKDCEQRNVVHSFQINVQVSSDEQPCRARELPVGCYYVELTFLGKKPSSETTQEASEEFSNSMTRLVIFFGLFLVVVFAYRYNKKKKSEKIDPNLIQLGKFHFDKRNTELILEKQVIELTSKEADLLILLYENANQTVEREMILNRVWGDEGDYVGRTLDVFISKLRKKLEADPNVKISNVRGVGYRLVVSSK